MASKALKNAAVRQLVSRGYASANPAPAIGVAKLESKLSGKTVVSAYDNGNPVTRVTIAFKAGPRYEAQSELGLVHVLRSAASLTNATNSTFIINRKLGQLGASISATADREFVYYTLEVSRDYLSPATELLTSIVNKPEFRPWELDDNLPRLKYDIVSLPPQVRAVDLLHKVAYRRGLGNSLFISPKRIGKVSSESLRHYAQNYLTADRCAIGAVGIDLRTASTIANALGVSSSSSADNSPAKYYGGELRKEMGGELAHVALAFEGAKAGTPQALALAVAAKALGHGPSVKWGEDNSALGKAFKNVGPVAAAGFNVNYSDTGLFGVVLSAPTDQAGNVINAAVAAIKSGISADALKAAKNRLKIEILEQQLSSSTFAEKLAADGLYLGSARDAAAEIAEIDKLTESNIAQVAAAALKTKPSIGAAGNLLTVPYADEIKN